MQRILARLFTATLFTALLALPARAQFFLNGSAVATNDSCFQLTTTVNGQVGSIWNGEKVNLNESFEVLVDLFLGCADLQGADGIVFGLQPISTSIGVSGGDIGFGSVQPSLGVEFDTYQNLDYNDPVFDHITVIRDGILNHNLPQGVLAGPVQANANDPNIEDCAYHPLRITWDATEQTLTVYLDCELRLSYTGDIVNEIFDGDPEVFWGFTSATGGLNNRHEICFSYTSFLDQLVDQSICPGEEIELTASGGVSYQWSPAAGLSDPTIANPLASPDTTTLYTVEIIDDCGIPFYDEVLITVDNDLFDVTIEVLPDPVSEVGPGAELTVTAVTTPAEEGPYTYAWSAALGSTFADPAADTTLFTSSLENTGLETITVVVTSEAGCVQEATLNLDIRGELYAIPNVFSPNNDGTNDLFGVFTVAELADYSCKVFNRWGSLIFESTNPSEFWDGTYNGERAPSDEYIYHLTFTIGERRREEKGGVTLVR
jgi:gliding motility-associated-like protein